MKNRSVIVMIGIVLILSIAYYIRKPSVYLYNFADTVSKGDVNGDNKVNSQDYILIKKSILKQYTLSNSQLNQADVNSDNKVNAQDYVLVKKIIMGEVIVPTSNITPKPIVTPTAKPTSSPTPKSILNPTTKPTITITPKPTVKPTVTIKPTTTPIPTVKPSTGKIHFLNTGESDAILLESNGLYGLMDTSWPNNSDVKNYLDKLGVKKLNFIIISHSDEDHIGGVPTLSKYIDSNTTYYYRNAYSNNNTSYYNNAMNTINAAKAKKNDVTNKTGVTFTLGDFKIEIMNTASRSSDENIVNDNKDSIVAYVTYKDKYGTLLTGDMESQDEYRMASIISKKTVDVLKVGHHSWQSSTTMKFTKAIKPKIAVVTNKILLEDISTPVYYMQQKYRTKFYLTGKSDNSVIIDYANNLSVSPSKASVDAYSVIQSDGQWRKLQNGIWFYIKSGNDLDTIAHNEWIKSNGKWYFLGIQGNMMIGFVEARYTENGKSKVGVFYLDEYGAMQTGWQQPKEFGPYDKSNLQSLFKSKYIYSHENYLVSGWYAYTGAWADGKKWFYFDPDYGYMLHNTTKTINGKSYTFNNDGVCTSNGC